MIHFVKYELKFYIFFLKTICVNKYNYYFYIKIIQSSTYGEILIYQKEELIKTYPCVMDHFK